MGQLKVYGIGQSRAMRTLWMCNELGLDYDHEPLHFADPRLKGEEYRSINPNLRVPAIEDGELRLWESMAINLYLAKKYGATGAAEGDGLLAPRDLEEEAIANQWSFWVMTEVEKPLLTVLLQRIKFPEGSAEEEYFRERAPKDAAVEQANLDLLARPLQVLDGALEDRAYLLGDRFSVADLNVASVLAWGQMAEMDFAPYPNAADWLGRCLARPAFAVTTGAS